MIACIFLMTTTIKGRGHDIARALSGFVCFPPPPIHDPPINKVFVFVLFALYAQRVLLCWKALSSRVAKKQNIFSQQINKILYQGKS